MDSRLKQSFDAEAFRAMGHEMVDLMADHLASVSQNEKANKNYQESNVRLLEWENHFNTIEDTPMDLFKKVLPQLVHLHHPNFMGHQVVAPAPISAISEFFSGLLNNGTAVYEMAAPAIAMEKIVCEWTAKQFGLIKGTGFLTSGGSLGNLTAVLAIKKIKAKGVSNPAIMVSSESHYCISRAAQIAGFGNLGILPIPITTNRTIDTNELERVYQEAKAKNINVVAIAANACSTATGVYDSLEPIGQFAKTHKLWFHIDGAHGSAAILSKYKGYLKGSALADSMVVDFHKMWLVSAPATAVLFKNAHDSYRTFEQKASYLWEKETEEEWYNLGKRTLECTKYMMALKIYASLKYITPAAIGAFVDQTYDLAQYMEKAIIASEYLECYSKIESNIVCFRYTKGINLNEVNRSIRKKLLTDGTFYIVQTEIDGILYLRTSLMSVNSNKSHIDNLLLAVIKTGISGT